MQQNLRDGKANFVLSSPRKLRLLIQNKENTQSTIAEAESYFQEALTIARQQDAKSWELRAALSLSELWSTQNRGKDAYDLLKPIYAWFTEGLDTNDLLRAKNLLKELEVFASTAKPNEEICV